MKPPRRVWGPSAQRFARGSVPPNDDNCEWMMTAVRARFPKLAAVMGDQVFSAMLGAFMVREPEAKKSLTWSNSKLPEFLAGEPQYPLWFSELALLDRAHVQVLHAPMVPPLMRRDLTAERELKLVPAHALVQLTTTSDELWIKLDDAAAACTRARVSLPRVLDWPRSVLMWRTDGIDIRDRVVDHDEHAALRAAIRGTSLVELAAGIGGGNPHARALDLVLRWIDDGILRGVSP
jgi:hypothetical protein